MSSGGTEIIAEQTATQAGLVLGFLTLIGTWFFSQRSSSSDSATRISEASLALADRYAAGEDRCLQKYEALSLRVDALQDELSECNTRHARAEAAMIAAGIQI